ncbi:MAG TPA: response regulator [Chthonomonadaceae bacterium]|nr:response regulator [Chthonomonadaceae bacterium]
MEAATLDESTHTLLVVDDEPLITDLFRQFMTKRGYRVLTATSGQQALATVEAEESIALVITDMTMPEMNGLEIANRLAQLRPRLPVLIATGHNTEDALANLPPNVVGIVQKPFQNKLLAERIHEILALG